MIVVGRHVFFRAVLRWGAALAFCYPLKHRERFWLRAVELLLSLMALTWLLDPMAQSNSLVQLQISLLGQKQAVRCTALPISGYPTAIGDRGADGSQNQLFRAIGQLLFCGKHHAL